MEHHGAMVLVMFTLLCISINLNNCYADGQWCISNPNASDDVLQKGIDWACGVGGADCSAIQPNQPCYEPNTVADHASYAFNSYWQKNKKQGATCDFSGAAQQVSNDPSHGDCKFQSDP
ncbi:Glucan endo-1,3-beta-glucosidase 12 [Acorus calamus]|uniref:Glucan endo-1,3-beta-glucosidase 12 n=1 Tax=Acorus calamus TaxID=4465 RepID=A0AAV9C058_ACOCL|nr:Glucan endo-1,3-beta-glucosidase 12 [Acorus calamus]